jgi:two-component system nitrogen regulation response regulator GlnG
LAGVEIRLPSLRERAEDIPLLAEHFLRSARGAPSATPGFTAAALEELVRRPWPGNVRELRNAVEHAAAFARGGPIRPDHLPPRIRVAEPQTGTREALAETVRRWAEEQLSAAVAPTHLHEQFLSQVEPALFAAVLAHTGGHRTAAAEILGIDRGTLRRRLS